MKYKVQYVNGKMAEFEADEAKIVAYGPETWLQLFDVDYIVAIPLRNLIVAIKTSSLWKVTTEEANETLVEEDGK